MKPMAMVAGAGATAGAGDPNPGEQAGRPVEGGSVGGLCAGWAARADEYSASGRRWARGRRGGQARHLSAQAGQTPAASGYAAPPTLPMAEASRACGPQIVRRNWAPPVRSRSSAYRALPRQELEAPDPRPGIRLGIPLTLPQPLRAPDSSNSSWSKLAGVVGYGCLPLRPLGAPSFYRGISSTRRDRGDVHGMAGAVL